MNTLIQAEGLSKKYCRSLQHSMYYGVKDIAYDIAGLKSSRDKLREQEFWALDDITFTVARGECVGLIGPNGAGKSTLLKILNGIIYPDKGSVTMRGKVAALIELGAGFHPLLTGRENIYINGAILGMSKREIDKKLDSIIEFAEIGDAIDSPVKHYSSGMYVRLGFAVAAHLSPDVLLIDEVLAVGDLSFQIKCMNFIQDLIKSGIAVIFVSHNLYQIQRICTSAVVIEHGKLSPKNETSIATDLYEEKYGQQSIPLTSAKTDTAFVFKSASLDSADNAPINATGYYTVKTCKPLRVIINYALRETIQEGIQIGLLIKSSDGHRIFGFTTMECQKVLPGEIGDYTLNVDFPQNLLLNGNYYIGLSAFNNDYTRQLSAWEAAVKFRVKTQGHNGLHTVGAVTIPHTFSLQCHGAAESRTHGIS